MTLAERLDSLLAAIRDGTAPPSFIVGLRDESERREAARLLHGRKGKDAIDLQIEPAIAYHDRLQASGHGSGLFAE